MSEGAAGFFVRRSDSRAARRRPTTARSGRCAPGSTPGPASATSPSGCTARATTFNWPSTTSEGGGRPSTQPAWNTRPRARRAPDGSARRGRRDHRVLSTPRV